MTEFRICGEPDRLLCDSAHLFTGELKSHPILDLACGAGHNGLFLAARGFQVIFIDRSKKALDQVQARAMAEGIAVDLRQVDLEASNRNPFTGQIFSAILVFRYLHRPLIPPIKDALMPGGIVLYETFTADQMHFGRPRNPDHLLKSGELLSWFRGWQILHSFEGITPYPPKAIAQLVCRKPRSPEVARDTGTP